MDRGRHAGRPDPDNAEFDGDVKKRGTVHKKNFGEQNAEVRKAEIAKATGTSKRGWK